MLKYIFKRLMAGVLTIIVLITVAFFMMHAMPGSPFTQSEQRDIPPEVLERMIASYGLDRPVFEQYLSYWNSLLHGDLGLSYKQANTSVNDIIETHFPVSARVGAVAVIVSLLIGIPLGLLAAVYRGRAIDMASMAFATIGISIPVFVISVLLMYLFANVLQWLPSYGLTSWRHYILPVACLSFNPIAYIARQTRSSMLDALEARGLRPTVPQRGDVLPFDSGASLTFLGPDDDVSDSDLNNRSLVTLFQAGGRSVLLMGDAEAAAERSLLNHYPLLSCEILKVGHHGANTSSSGEFLCAVRPSTAVISCGVNNDYGHPSPQTLENLSLAGVGDVRITAESGTVVLPLDPLPSSKENAA